MGPFSVLLISKSFIGTKFYKEGFGHSCPFGLIIHNKETCKASFKELGLVELSIEVNEANKPGGCYWKSGYWGYFNKMIDQTTSRTTYHQEGISNIDPQIWTMGQASDGWSGAPDRDGYNGGGGVCLKKGIDQYKYRYSCLI